MSEQETNRPLPDWGGDDDEAPQPQLPAVPERPRVKLLPSPEPEPLRYAPSSPGTTADDADESYGADESFDTEAPESDVVDREPDRFQDREDDNDSEED